MNKDRNNTPLPQKSYSVLVSGLLVTVTNGVPGYLKSPLDSGDKLTNRLIADKQNRLLGVTREQASALFKAMLFFHEPNQIVMSADKPPAVGLAGAKPISIFEVEINCSGYLPNAIVSLPATWAELNDALEKINAFAERNIIDGKGICRVDVCDSQPENLMQIIPKNANLFELNHFAERLATLDDFEMSAFEGLMTMDAVRTDYATIPVERLINMTHSLADCQVAYEAHDDESLGKFYADNDFIPELETLPEKIFPWLDYSKIGKEMRIGEGGVFTPSGYVVHSGEMSTEYSTDKLQRPEKPDYVFKLEIAAAPLGDEPNNARTADLKLPATADDIRIALDKVGGNRLQDCVFYGFDSILPQITGALFADMENFAVLNELAGQVRELERCEGLTTYKAMLSIPTLEIALEDALTLSYQTDGFSLRREVCSPDDYARNELEKLGIPLGDELCSAANFYSYGKKLMARDNAIPTDYGTLVSLDGQTLEQCLERQEPEQSGMCQSMT